MRMKFGSIWFAGTTPFSRSVEEELTERKDFPRTASKTVLQPVNAAAAMQAKSRTRRIMTGTILWTQWMVGMRAERFSPEENHTADENLSPRVQPVVIHPARRARKADDFGLLAGRPVFVDKEGHLPSQRVDDVEPDVLPRREEIGDARGGVEGIRDILPELRGADLDHLPQPLVAGAVAEEEPVADAGAGIPVVETEAVKGERRVARVAEQ